MGVVQITGGALRSRKITFTEAKGLRPTLSKTREAIFNILASYIDFSTASFLDLYGGSGIMALEAKSRGFESVFCNEANPLVAKNIKNNIRELSVKITLSNQKAESFITSSQQAFDVIYIDPPYYDNLYDKILKLIIDKNSLKKGGFIIIEKNAKTDVNFDNFTIFKEKTYSNKDIVFLTL